MKLKLLPTLICFALVGLLAALIPYPGLSNILVVLPVKQGSK